MESCTACNSACELVPGIASYCGDGVTDHDAGETCDEAGLSPELCPYGEACEVCLECQVRDGDTSFCGDGVVQAEHGEQCDQGTGNSDVLPDACRTNCTPPVCGDEVTDSAEGCDDGNLRFVTLSLGPNHSCGVLADGSLRCWGDLLNDGSGPDLTAAPTGNFTDVAAGDFHSCAITAAGTVECWGMNNAGQATPPTGTFVKVTVGTNFSCGIRTDATIECWGLAGYHNRRPNGSFVQISGASSEVCALTTGGNVYCWTQFTVPAGRNGFQQIDGGMAHFCALRTNGEISCWGRNTEGQSAAPQGTYVQVTAGSFESCALREDRTAVCWGRDMDEYPPPSIPLASISASFGAACGTDDAGRMHCWGLDSTSGHIRPPGNSDERRDACRTDCQPAHCGDGILDSGEQCDDGNTVDEGDGCSATCMWNGECGDGIVQSLLEECDDGNTELESCAYGVEDCSVCGPTCTTVQGQTSYCGDGVTDSSNGEECDDGLENSDTEPSACRTNCTVPYCGDGIIDLEEECDDGNSVTEVCAYGEVSCTVCSADCESIPGATSWCGDGVVDETAGESCDDSEGRFLDIAPGGGFTCGQRDADRAVRCWGSNLQGQSSAPAGRFLPVSAGANHACAVESESRAVVCWGDNSSGQSNEPTGLFWRVSAGERHTCGLRTSGFVTCWGLGAATPPATQFGKISAGRLHTCGIQYSGTISCWGDDAAGQSSPPTGSFGDVSAGWRTTCAIRSASHGLTCWGDLATIGAPPAGEFVRVSVGLYHACAVRRNTGEVVCWGSPENGVLDAPEGAFRSVASGPYNEAQTCALRDGSWEPVCWGYDYVETLELPVMNSDSLPDACRHTCELPWCGDGVVDTGEACDDGNSLPNDGCDATCQIE
jgi:cysteine-rich repeat protein